MAEQSNTGAPLVKILGKYGSAMGYAIRDFLYRSGVPFELRIATPLKARRFLDHSLAFTNVH